MSQRKPIISARRTENLEALLQKLWTLQPMYKNRPSFTITAGVAALIREIEALDRISGNRVSLTAGQSSTVEVVDEQTTPQSAIDMSTAERAAANISNDVEW